ncbi:MAG TPA: UDP-glucose 4-epimerase GalE [Terriglobia bacterium]|nr:UDP-glucose 4-epimerase GalE [Terriglobia bacterium]
MRVLVTGGAGYIGSHAVRRLRQAGHEPVIYDNLSTGHKLLAEGFECIVGDVADRGALRRALRGIDAVMHLAADSSVRESVGNPRKYFENNVGSGLSLLHAMLDAGIRRVILSSTCAVYGRPSAIPIPVDAPRIPANPYGATKLALEHALEAYSAAYGLRYVSLRYFNAAGADESGETGEMHQPETHLIPLALEAAAGLRSSVAIYGTDYPTPDGTCIRDYIHVNDLAEAHLRALEYLREGGPSAAFNLGSGAGHSVLEVLGMVEAVTGRRLKTQRQPRRPGEPPVLVSDSTAARQQLHWIPARSLRQSVATAWKWMQSDRYAQLQRAAALSGETSLRP